MERVILIKKRLLLNLEDLKQKIENNAFKGIQGWSHSYVGSDYKRLALQVRKDLITLEHIISNSKITFRDRHNDNLEEESK